MKTKSKIFSLFLAGFLLILLFSCKKETPQVVPTLTTASVTNVTSTTAMCGGDISSNGGSAITACGVCWSTSQNPTIADSKTSEAAVSGSFTSTITGLTPGATYYIRAYATNSVGTAYGNQVSTAALAVLPTISTAALSGITTIAATSGGNITNDGGGAITARGVCWSTTTDPTVSNNKTTDGTGSGSFTSAIAGLTAGATYYVRAYATNSAGTAYGNQETLTTYSAVDADGNYYTGVTIGTQTWLVENLMTTKYNDGTPIPNVADDNTWAALTTDAYCWYNNNDLQYKFTYGALYNWNAVITDKLCPAGWHVPSDDEWTALTTYLGGEGVAAGKLKEAGTIHWLTPNTGATNETGFKALPGGYRTITGPFSDIGTNGLWTSSTVYGTSNRWGREMHYDGTDVIIQYYGKKRGLSVRCVKD